MFSLVLVRANVFGGLNTMFSMTAVSALFVVVVVICFRAFVVENRLREIWPIRYIRPLCSCVESQFPVYHCAAIC